MKKLIAILLALVFIANAEAQTPSKIVKWASVTPTVTAASAYTAKDSVGGLLTFSRVPCGPKETGRVVAVIVTDASDNAMEYDLNLFRAAPTASTGAACTGTKYICDKNAFDPLDAELVLMLPDINLASTDHFSFTDNGMSSLSSLGSSVYSIPGSLTNGTLYGALVARSTPTFANTNDVTVSIGVECD